MRCAGGSTMVMASGVLGGCLGLVGACLVEDGAYGLRLVGCELGWILVGGCGNGSLEVALLRLGELGKC